MAKKSSAKGGPPKQKKGAAKAGFANKKGETAGGKAGYGKGKKK